MVQETDNSSSSPVSIKDQIKQLREEVRYGNQKRETEKKEKGWKWPWRTRWTMAKANGKAGKNKVLVLFLNRKGELEQPKLLPLINDLVIINNEPYDADPRAILRMGKNRVYLIREIDRRPVSNLDWKEVKERGDLVGTGDLLLKAMLRAHTAYKQDLKKPVSMWVWIILAAVVIGIIWLFSAGG